MYRPNDPANSNVGHQNPVSPYQLHEATDKPAYHGRHLLAPERLRGAEDRLEEDARLGLVVGLERLEGVVGEVQAGQHLSMGLGGIGV